MNEENPAMIAARNSWRCVQAGDREGWLALMSEDVCIEDPIGVAPTNPTGEGVRGKAAVGEFFDKNIARNELSVETHESRTAGSESAHVLTLRTRFPNGTTAIVRGVFTYLVDAEGLLTNLRGYWEMDDMSFETPPESDVPAE